MWRLEQKYFTNEINHDEFTTDEFYEIEDYVVESSRDTGWYEDEEIFEFLNDISVIGVNEFFIIPSKGNDLSKEFIKITKIA